MTDHLTIETVREGQRVVIASQHLGYFTPLCHNKGRCSGIVVKVGRKYAHVESSGAPWRVRIDADAPATSFRVYDMRTARKLYAESISHLKGDEHAAAMATL